MRGFTWVLVKVVLPFQTNTFLATSDIFLNLPAYVLFMKFNVQAELGFKKLIGSNKVHDPQLVQQNNVSAYIEHND